MSDAQRPSSTDQESTVIRSKDDFYGKGSNGQGSPSQANPNQRGAGEPRQNLADKLMGRLGGRDARAQGRPASSSSSQPASSSQPGNSPQPAPGAAPADQERAGRPSFTQPRAQSAPVPAQQRVEPTGSAVSAVPAPARTGASTSGTRPAEPEPGATERRDTLPADDSTASKVGAVLKGRPNTTRRTRKARLRLASIDPWSVMKMAFLFSIAAGIALIVATAVVWFVIGQSGLFDSINKMVNDVFSTPGDTTPFDLSQYLSAGRIIGSAVLLSVIDVVLFTALATVGAFLYNTGATLLGGVELTLADD